MGIDEELMQYKERKELIYNQYQAFRGDLIKLEEWYKKEYGSDDIVGLIFVERSELIIEHYKTSNSDFQETVAWYDEEYKDDIDIGDAETIVNMALEEYLEDHNLPQYAPDQSIVEEVAKRNLTPSEIMANYMPNKEGTKGCMITILIMITATSLTSLLFL